MMDSKALKYTTFHRTAFDTYKAIIPFNVKFGETKMVCIKDTLHVSNSFVNLLLVSKFLSNELNMQYNLN